MAKYKKKSVIVEAVQWFSGVEIDGVEVIKLLTYENMGVLQTLDGLLFVNSGDWILTEIVSGKQHLCKPEVFQETYVEVTDILV